jgi:hypothetical protein
MQNRETGSHLGGDWVKEGEPEVRNVAVLRADVVARIQDKGDYRGEETRPAGR